MFWAKFNAKLNSALIFSIILTLLRLVFSKEAILFLIYLLAGKAKSELKSEKKAQFIKSKDEHFHEILNQ